MNTTILPTKKLSSAQNMLLLSAVFLTAACTLIYELAIGTITTAVSTNSTHSYSLVIGVFVAALGIGAYGSRWINTGQFDFFVFIELAIAIFGTCSVLIMSKLDESSHFMLASMGLSTVLAILMGIELPLLASLVETTNTRDRFATALASDYLGGLAGSLAYGFVLEPRWGVLNTAFLIGATNLIIAILSALLFYNQLIKPKWLLVLASVAVTAFTVIAKEG